MSRAPPTVYLQSSTFPQWIIFHSSFSPSPTTYQTSSTYMNINTSDRPGLDHDTGAPFPLPPACIPLRFVGCRRVPPSLLAVCVLVFCAVRMRELAAKQTCHHLEPSLATRAFSCQVGARLRAHSSPHQPCPVWGREESPQAGCLLVVLPLSSSHKALAGQAVISRQVVLSSGSHAGHGGLLGVTRVALSPCVLLRHLLGWIIEGMGGPVASLVLYVCVLLNRSLARSKATAGCPSGSGSSYS